MGLKVSVCTWSGLQGLGSGLQGLGSGLQGLGSGLQGLGSQDADKDSRFFNPGFTVQFVRTYSPLDSRHVVVLKLVRLYAAQGARIVSAANPL